MFAQINNLITKKTFLTVFFSVLFLAIPLSIDLLQNDVSIYFNLASAGVIIDSVENTLLNQIGEFIGGMLLTIPASLTWVGGYFLDASLDNFVFGMGGKVNGQINLAITNSWKLIRDICNLAFIFGFVYIGIRTIIDPDSASTKRFLSKIVIGALLINFSLFFVKFIIDIGNFTAYQVYIAMVDTANGGTLSATIADKLGIMTLYSSPSNANTFGAITGWGSIWFFVFAAILLFIIAFVFFAAAIQLIIRFVALIFIMIGSPILFAATIFPQTESYASDLWKKLIHYSFFAPVFLVLLLISITMIGNLGIVQNGDHFVDMVKGGAPQKLGALGVALNFIVIIFFFVQSLLLAQKMGIAGGEAAVSMGNKIRGNVQSAIGRNTVGRAGEWSSKKIQDMRENPNSRTARLTGGLLHATVGGVADSAKGAKFGGSMSRTDAKKDNESLGTARAKNAQVGNISKSITETVTTHASGSTATQAQKDAARMKMEQAVSGASTEQLQDLLKEHKDNPDAYNELVGNMSSSQFESVLKLKPEDFDDSKKAKLSASRAAFMKNKHGVVGGTTGATPGTIGKADASELDAMDFETVVQHAGQLTTKQIDDMKSIKDSPTKKKALKDARNSELIKEFKPAGVSTPASATRLFNRITNDTERSKLPPEILTDVKSAQHLNANVLTKILDNDSIGSAERTTIKANVQMIHGNNAFNNFFSTPAGGRYT